MGLILFHVGTFSDAKVGENFLMGVVCSEDVREVRDSNRAMPAEGNNFMTFDAYVEQSLMQYREVPAELSAVAVGKTLEENRNGASKE